MVQLRDVWLKHFAEWVPHALPTSYIALDTETIGPGNDQLVTDIGYVIVKNSEVVERATWVLNWTDEAYHEWVSPEWVDEACQIMTRVMHRPLNVDVDRMRKEGEDPRTVLRRTLKLLEDVVRHRLPLVGNNVEHFDVRVLGNHFNEWLDGATFDKTPLAILDPGLLFKALRSTPTPLPRYSDNLPKYLKRIKGLSNGQKYGLEYCLSETGLLSNLDPTQLHGAEYDSYCSHLLFEQLRKELA